MQSYLRTKAHDYGSYRGTMELKANSSNNTIFADADGDTAYFQGNFIPRRDTRFDWSKPVDGADPDTEWHGLLSVDETPHLLNPKTGWLYNSNNWPWSAAGPSSPKKEDYPAYVENGGESARGRHAIRVLENRKDFTLDSLIAAAYDSYLPWFEKPIPALVNAWEQNPAGNPVKSKLGEQIALLRAWDLRWGVTSVATSLAVFWGEEIRRESAPKRERRVCPSKITPAAKCRLSNFSSRWRRHPTNSSRTSGTGRRRGATSIDFNGSRATSCSLSTMPARPFPSASRPRCGDRSPHSVRARILERSGMAPAGTALWQWLNSAIACEPRGDGGR